jgi:hypothetical protein
VHQTLLTFTPLLLLLLQARLWKSGHQTTLQQLQQQYQQ